MNRNVVIPRCFVRIGAVPFRGQGLGSQSSNPTFVARGDCTAEFPLQAKHLSGGLSVRPHETDTQKTPINLKHSC